MLSDYKVVILANDDVLCALQDALFVQLGTDGLVVGVPVHFLAFLAAVGGGLATAASLHQGRRHGPLAAVAKGKKVEHLDSHPCLIFLHHSDDPKLVHLEIHQLSRHGL